MSTIEGASMYCRRVTIGEPLHDDYRLTKPEDVYIDGVLFSIEVEMTVSEFKRATGATEVRARGHDTPGGAA